MEVTISTDTENRMSGKNDRNPHTLTAGLTMSEAVKKETMSSTQAGDEQEAISSSTTKSLKRCLSVPIIHGTMTTRSAAAAAAAIIAAAQSAAKPATTNVTTTTITTSAYCTVSKQMHETPKKHQKQYPDSSTGTGPMISNMHVPRSQPNSREVSPAPMYNIFAPRARRYSASYSPMAHAQSPTAHSGSASPLCMTPRISQLRQEECADVNTREVNHEREVHSTIQISQSWEDLTIVAEAWSCKTTDEPLQVVLPTGASSCSSPSPTSNRAGLRLPYGLSPSPTRRTFATRRSMSPIAMRPSSLGPVKRKFELDDNAGGGNWNVYSPPPMKKIFSESRGSSPVCQSPSSVCPSPDSGTYDGRITPKLYISKLCTNNNNNNSSSACSSPMSASPPTNLSSITVLGGTLSSSSSSQISSSASGRSGIVEPMCIGNSIDEGISLTDSERSEKVTLSHQCSTTSSTGTRVEPMSTDITDEASGLMLDDIDKSETSSIGGCSTISVESSSWDSGAKSSSSSSSSSSSASSSSSCSSVTFHNKLLMDDVHMTSVLGQKNFIRQAKKFIVNHENLPNSRKTRPNTEQMADSSRSIKVSSTTLGTNVVPAPPLSDAGVGKVLSGSVENAVAAADIIVENN